MAMSLAGMVTVTLSPGATNWPDPKHGRQGNNRYQDERYNKLWSHAGQNSSRLLRSEHTQWAKKFCGRRRGPSPSRANQLDGKTSCAGHFLLEEGMYHINRSFCKSQLRTCEHTGDTTAGITLRHFAPRAGQEASGATSNSSMKIYVPVVAPPGGEGAPPTAKRHADEFVNEKSSAGAF